MKIKVTRLFPLVVFFFFTATVFAQKDSQQVDMLEKATALQSQHMQDSLKKMELEKQLDKVRPNDHKQKTELLKQLQELKEEEFKRGLREKEEMEALRKAAQSAPVMGFFDDTLFMIYYKRGSASILDRANTLTARIHMLGEQLGFAVDSLKLEETEATVNIVYGETTVMSISENDAIWNNASQKELAEQYLAKIREAITKYKTETSFGKLAREIGGALAVLLILSLLIYACIRLFRFTAKKIEQEENKGIKGIHMKEYTLFDTRRQIKLLLVVNRIVKWMLILTLIYITLPIVFGFFPWTRNLAGTLFSYILSPLEKIATGLYHYLPNLITIIVIIVVFRFVLRGMKFLKQEIESGNLVLPGFYKDWANPTFQIIRVLTLAFMLIIIFPYLPGSDSPVFQGVSVFLGFLFTFGSAGSLSNIIAGLVLTYMRLFKLGDIVKIADTTGMVIEKSMLVTRIRTIKNEVISIPNSTVMSSHTINYTIATEDKGLIIHTKVTIGYDTPWRDMHQALLNAADRTEELLKDPKPFVHQTALNDFYVEYEINAYTLLANKQAHVYSELHQNIQDCCNEVGIEIMSPHYRAERDGNKTTIPTNYNNKKDE